jgi:hypothetical protein
MRAHDAAHEDRAASAAAPHRVDSQSHEAVVDQHLVAGLEHVADNGRAHRKLAVLGRVLADDDDRVQAGQRDRSGKLADP